MTGAPPFHRFGAWESANPGVAAGITAVRAGAGAGSESDYGLTTGGSSSAVAGRYAKLAAALGMESCSVARQVHGVRVVTAEDPVPGQLNIVGEADGLVTDRERVLLAVTAADCVPVFIADAESRRIGLFHAGWRGAAAGILERGLGEFRNSRAGLPSCISVHLGPCICASCYEVGDEVLAAFGIESSGPAFLDLRAELTARAIRAGVPERAVTRSEWCTRCGPVNLHSHRAQGAEAGRMAAFLGLDARPQGSRTAKPRGLRS